MRNKTVRICAFLCILLFTAAAVAVILQYGSKTPDEIEITVDGKTIYRGEGKTDGEPVYIDAVGQNGTNRVRIDSNGVKVESASCPNGECVAMGMPCMASSEAAAEIRKVLSKYDLPSAIPFSAEELMPYILHDKKMASGKVTIVYVDRIGSYEFRQAGPEELKSYILKRNY